MTIHLQRSCKSKRFLCRYQCLMILAASFLVGCAETTAPPLPNPISFVFPSSLGTTWEYNHTYYYSNIDGAGPFSTSHRARQTWEVVSVTPYPDSTEALVRAIRIDTLHYKHEIWNPNFPDIDTTYIVTDTISFPMVISSQRFIARWTNTLFIGPWPALDTIPRPLASNTYTANAGPVQAWFSTDSGLTKYAGSLSQKFFWAETLTLKKVLPK